MDSLEITDLLGRWQAADEEATERLMSFVYSDLRRLAASRLRDAGTVSLEATDLAHEAYLRLGDQRAGWVSREHFFAIASRVIRRIVMDQHRHRGRAKRGGGMAQVTLRTGVLADAAINLDLLALNAALEELSAIDEDAVRIVEMRFFAGMTNQEIALAIDASPSTVGRRWRFARAWLEQRLLPDGRP